MLPGLGTITYEVDTNTLNAAGQEFIYRLSWLSATLILGSILIVVIAQYAMPNLALFNRLVLTGEETKEEGFYAGSRPEELPSVGDEGEVAATLRPAGRVIIQGENYDAVSSGGFLERGTTVVVVRIEGSKIVVQEREDQRWKKDQEV